MHEISNGLIKVGVNTFGAELEYIKVNNINILWKRNDLWGAQSPVLFPIIGALKDGYYFYEGKRYEIQPHGFVKGMFFEVAHLDKNKIILSQKYNEETLKCYPYKFELLITYLIIENSLKIIFEIKNLDIKDLPFSIGIHPGFSYNGLENLLGKDYQLKFYPNKVDEVVFSPTFVLGKTKSEINYKTFNDMSIDLSTKRTICLEGVNTLEIQSKKNKLIFKNEMSYMAFWQKNPEYVPEFMCIEAWEGIPDEEVKNCRNLCDKLGNIILKKNESFKKEFEIKYEEE